MASKFIQWPQNIPNGHKTFQQFPFCGPPKYTQISIFVMKMYHLATLIQNPILWALLVMVSLLIQFSANISRQLFKHLT
jgi:hypothetical protein